MAITVRPPQPGEMKIIGQMAAEKWVRDAFNSGAISDDFYELEKVQIALIDGVPVAGGGFIDRGDGIAYSWSLIAGDIAKKDFVGLCRLFRRRLRATPYRVVEAHCFEAFTQSHRWCRAIGFEPITEAPQFAPDGRRFRRFIFRNKP